MVPPGEQAGEAFIELLRRNLAIQKIVAGHNFRFGKGRDTGTDDLKEMLSTTGIELQVTEPVMRIYTETTDPARVNRMLDMGETIAGVR